MDHDLVEAPSKRIRVFSGSVTSKAAVRNTPHSMCQLSTMLRTLRTALAALRTHKHSVRVDSLVRWVSELVEGGGLAWSSPTHCGLRAR